MTFVVVCEHDMYVQPLTARAAFPENNRIHEHFTVNCTRSHIHFFKLNRNKMFLRTCFLCTVLNFTILELNIAAVFMNTFSNAKHCLYSRNTGHGKNLSKLFSTDAGFVSVHTITQMASSIKKLRANWMCKIPRF